MPTAHKVLVKAGKSALSRTSTAATSKDFQSNNSQLKSNTGSSSTKQRSGRWSEDEHKLFLQGLEQHGRKWEKITAVVGTRTERQIKSHAQKYFANLESTKTKETDELEVEDEPMMFHVSWDERFQQLVEYKKQNGHCRVPQRYKANPQLGRWVNTQRKAYKKGKLSPEQIKSLEGIGFKWVLEKQEHSVGRWDERFKQLKEYRQVKGDCNVPYQCDGNPQLGHWVHNQRTAYKKGKLSPEQIKSLEGIGFVWVPPRGLGRTSAAATATSMGSTSASDGSTKEIAGRWSEYEHKLFLQGLEQHGRKWEKIAAVVETRTQRQIKSHAQKYFAKLERLERDELEVEDESMMCRMSWDERFQQLVEYKEQNGHCRVSQRYKANLQLAKWVSTQRQVYNKTKKGKLLPEQIKSLEGIEFEWELKQVSWDERFQQIVEYKEQNGHSRVPQRYKANPQLGQWVNKQRQHYKKNELLPEQKDRLEGIGFEWYLRLGWDERLEELKQYRQVKGDCSVPNQYDANPQLGYWVQNQRQAYKKGKLSTGQIKSLECVGFVWELPRGPRSP